METESPMEATGSQNRDEHPIPKEIVTPTIPYSQLLAREEEDEILGPGTTATPSPTTPDKVQQLKAEVVEHCRDMRKSLMSITKADHHRAALRENLRTKEFLRDSVRMCSPTQSKRHNPELEQPCWCRKGCLCLVFWCNGDLSVTSGEVQCGYVFASSQPVYEFIYARHGVCILGCY